MEALPVFATVRRAYAFIFRNIPGVLAAAVIPIAILTALGYFYRRWHLEQALASNGPAPPAFDNIVLSVLQSAPEMLAVNLVEAVLVAVAAVGIHRLVLFGQRSPAISVGPVETRFVGVASMAAAASIAYFYMAFFAMFTIVQQSAGWAVLLMTAVQIALGIACLRLTLVFPAIIAEGRISFRRAWELSDDSFWRMLFVNILAFLPIGIVGMAVQAFAMPKPPWAYLVPNDPAAWRNLLQWNLDNQLTFEIVGGVGLVATTIIGVVVLSLSYKHLAGHEPDEVLTPPGARPPLPPVSDPA